MRKNICAMLIAVATVGGAIPAGATTITNREQLAAISYNLAGTYALAADIDLAAFASPAETIRMPVPVAIDATTGHATIDFDLGEFLALLYPEVPQAFRDQVNMPSALFIRPAITTIYPDDYTDFIYLLVTEPEITNEKLSQ